MDKISRLIAGPLGQAILLSLFHNKEINEIDRLNFLLSEEEEPLCEIYRIDSRPEVPELPARFFFQEDDRPHYRQIEHRDTGLRGMVLRSKR